MITKRSQVDETSNLPIRFIEDQFGEELLQTGKTRRNIVTNSCKRKFCFTVMVNKHYLIVFSWAKST